MLPAGTLATGAVATAGPRFDAARVRLDVEIDAGAPLVRVDPERLAEVLANLLDNALRHTSAGGAVRVVVRADRGATGPAVAVLEAVDTGEGFDPADANRIFERCYRSDASRTHTAAGSGIGLTIARAIVEAHGGTRTAALADVGPGAVFRITLPAV